MKEVIATVSWACVLSGIVTFLAAVLTLNGRFLAWSYVFGMISLTGMAVLHLKF